MIILDKNNHGLSPLAWCEILLLKRILQNLEEAWLVVTLTFSVVYNVALHLYCQNRAMTSVLLLICLVVVVLVTNSSQTVVSLVSVNLLALPSWFGVLGFPPSVDNTADIRV